MFATCTTFAVAQTTSLSIVYAGQQLKICEVYAEKSFLGQVAVEGDHKYVGYTSHSTCVEAVAAKLWAGILAAKLNGLQFHLITNIDTYHFNLNHGITDRVIQQKLGKLASYGFPRKLSRRVQPDPVISFIYFL